MHGIKKMKNIFVLASIILVLFLFALSCEHADPVQPEQLQPTFPSIQSNIFNLNCALSGCHTGSNPASGLNLSEGNAYGNLVGVSSQEVSSLQRVEPGDPDNSYLIIKLEGADPRLQGERMPRGREPLTQEQINVIRQWIANGALPEGNAPAVSNIPDQTIIVGESFNSFDLDDFVTDADHPDSLINWTINMSANADTVFSVSIDAGHVVTIDIVDSSFTGSEIFTFTAIDPDSLSDRDTARFTILPPQLTFTQIQVNIFNQKCAVPGCHVQGSAAFGLVLSAGEAYGNLVNVPSGWDSTLARVEPGNPDDSFLIIKLEGTDPRLQGQPMPFGGSKLPQSEIEAIKNWIREGAPNN